MKEKIVINVIEVVEKTVDVGDSVLTLALGISKDNIIDDVFLFANEHSRDSFMDMAQDNVRLFAKEVRSIGFTKGYLTGIAVGIVGVVLGTTIAIVLDNRKTRKKTNELDI